MKKSVLISLTFSSLLFTPLAFANTNCGPDSATACPNKLEQECRYYLMDDELDDDFDFRTEDDYERGHEDDFEESMLLNDLQSLSLTPEQESLLTDWKRYNTQFDQDWVALCIAHPNKDNSLTDQLNWDEVNLKNDLSYLQESRIFVGKVNASLTETQKQQLVQLGLMQVLP
ncbi:hypothetical protein A9Q77_02790 [Marinomonas sp. 42_23_T18]|nr:hypothetical protein A9Q77_02790 [Marinomonas sp. 42_23_T18]